ncbi:Glycine betaine ABC transporter, substrate-binding protein OtaC [Candidatus Syntrophocurvum alkaliphilum]|uniref:Glycine betaine ABC transporter, substrate-binding protein OtaC n=1 Tax=Candidatus Syntrophocurvum alkaliphilum TaxID=2293317 RepID=A0A6I6DCK2_9FIRM|nr:glycine betaine ABC transporter substrate-binding protein [Candidatus Syntrophocurvum alkaliphilum]QGT99035.1 Glycine betaine ABC transporter, substrate-binding protein OtaC [Candidatus Syntrophocurvum alkaliphilum]
MMLKKQSKLLALIALIMFATVSVMGCGPADDPDVPDVQDVTLLYVEWDCANATTHIMAHILENEIGGYNVETMPLAASAMYTGLATGDGDAMVTAWLPVTHAEYMDQYGDQIEDLGPAMEGAVLGLVAPEYAEFNSIEELPDYVDELNGEIVGIDPGAGVMGLTEDLIVEYGLDEAGFELVEGSDATMTAALDRAISNEEPVVVTGWAPHWKFGSYDLKILEDPKLILGEEETINNLVRQGLQEDLPEVYELLSNHYWTPDDLGDAMVMVEEMGDTQAAAEQWVAENQDLVNQWLP